MIATQWIENYLWMFGWEVTPLTLNLWLLGMVVLLIGITVIQDDLGRLISKARQLAFTEILPLSKKPVTKQ